MASGERTIPIGLAYNLALPAWAYGELYQQCVALADNDSLAALFGDAPYNFLGPLEGLYMSKSRELQRETPFTRTGKRRTHKSGVKTFSESWVCATRREFGNGHGCFTRSQTEYTTLYVELFNNYSRVFQRVNWEKLAFSLIGVWEAPDFGPSLAFIQETNPDDWDTGGAMHTWSVVRKGSHSFDALMYAAEVGDELVLQRRAGRGRSLYLEVDEELKRQFRLKIVSLVPLAGSGSALTARLVGTLISYSEAQPNHGSQPGHQ